MTIGTINHSATYTPASLQVAAQPSAAEDKVATKGAQQRGEISASQAPAAQTPATDTKVSISDDARKLQADDRAAQSAKAQVASLKETKSQEAEKDMGDKAEAFAYGALGMDHPEDVKANSDGYYNAGQWLAAAGTVATVLLAIA